MATILSIADIIEIGDASTYLSSNYTSKQSLFGKNLTKPVPPVQIAFVTDALRWGSDGGAQTTASLRSTANYLYWMCGLFQLQAQNIISGPGGGSISPSPSGGSVPNPYDWEVSASTSSTSPMKSGDTMVTLTLFIGYNIDFFRNSLTQYTTNPGDGSTYYSWSKTTGVFILLNGAANLTEKFRIMPSK